VRRCAERRFADRRRGFDAAAAAWRAAVHEIPVFSRFSAWHCCCSWFCSGKQPRGEEIVKKLIAVSLTMLAMLGASTVSAEVRVLGESLDSGLGALPSTYSADEYRKK
jgi:hypothetical protein